MKLLLDQGIPRSTAALLRERGVDTVHAGELDLSAAADTTIIENARRYGYCIVTLDADFQSLLAVASAPGPSVVRLRVQRLKASAAAALIWSVLERTRTQLDAGCFVTVTASFASASCPFRETREGASIEFCPPTWSTLSPQRSYPHAHRRVRRARPRAAHLRNRTALTRLLVERCDRIDRHPGSTRS